MRTIGVVVLSLVWLTGCGKTPVSPPSVETLGWESSGGDGIACFADRADAEATDRLVGVWPEALRKKIQSVTALEMFEHPEHTWVGWTNRTREQILAIQTDRFRELAPIFHSRFELAAGKVRLADWKPQSQLPDVTDSKPAEAILKRHPNCRLVQMAIRHSLSTPGKLPQVWIEVDQYLFEQKMDALSQAVLIAHEQMYLLGREIGHKNSDFLRGVVAELFSDAFGLALGAQKFHSLSARLLQSLVGSAYGDYYNFFLEDPATFLPVTPAGTHPYSRYRSFGTLLKLLRTRKGDCLAQNEYDRQTKERQAELQEQCSFHAVNPALVTDLLDDEQTFLYLARWLLDAVGAIDTSENFVVWDPKDPTRETAYQKAERRKACQHLAASDYVYFRKAVAKALAYCARVP